jgi:hypothetical protein
MCCGEAFHRLGAQGVKVLILVGALPLPSVAPVSQGGFGVGAQAICFLTIVALLDLQHSEELFKRTILHSFSVCGG